jgi:hypothetical protein
MYSYSSILSLNVACCGKNGMEKSWIDFGSDGWEGGSMDRSVTYTPMRMIFKTTGVYCEVCDARI